jgi:hypothetical protein
MVMSVACPFTVNPFIYPPSYFHHNGAPFAHDANALFPAAAPVHGGGPMPALHPQYPLFQLPYHLYRHWFPTAVGGAKMFQVGRSNHNYDRTFLKLKYT